MHYGIIFLRSLQSMLRPVRNRYVSSYFIWTHWPMGLQSLLQLHWHIPDRAAACSYHNNLNCTGCRYRSCSPGSYSLPELPQPGTYDYSDPVQLVLHKNFHRNIQRTGCRVPYNLLPSGHKIHSYACVPKETERPKSKQFFGQKPKENQMLLHLRLHPQRPMGSEKPYQPVSNPEQLHRPHRFSVHAPSVYWSPPPLSSNQKRYDRQPVSFRYKSCRSCSCSGAILPARR